MTRTEKVEERFADATLNLALDTLGKKKQALVFCNTKRGAESQAERIAIKIKHPDDENDLLTLSESILHALSSPTKQCKRLASCVKAGVAFHHSGLASRQREIVETAFRAGIIKIICATPTLAMGMDLPAFRSIIRDLKRYSQGTSWSMADIPVLEYEQMSGRAGRPGKEDFGQAICIASTESDRDRIVEKYLLGDPEEIYSKLAVEPVLRTYILSLIASGYVHDRNSLEQFFSQTFYAWEYGDMERLNSILLRMTQLLETWGFLEGSANAGEFQRADDLSEGRLRATPLGERVAQLYLDPYTAHHVLTSIHNGLERGTALTPFGLLHLLATTLEIRPLFSVRQGEIEGVDREILKRESDLFVKPPTIYSYEYEEFLQTIKVALVFESWIDEIGEDVLLETFNVTPGDLQAKKSIIDWILHSLMELAKLKGWQRHIGEMEKLRVRIEHGAREDILALLRLRGIGRVRARKLYQNNIKSIEGIKVTEYSTLRSLLGEKLAIDVKEQVGQKVSSSDVQVKTNKRKGQINLQDYDGKKET